MDTNISMILAKFSRFSQKPIKLLPTNKPGFGNETLANHDIIFMVYYYGILFIISVFNLTGNSLVINAFIRHRSIRTPGNYFIFSLAVSDLIFGLVYPVYNTLHVDNEDILSVLGNWHTCTFVLTLTLALLSISSFNLVGITVVRFISIKDPLTFYNKVTHVKAVAVILCIWIGLFGLSAAVFLRPQNEDPDFHGICRYELFLGVHHLAFTAAISFIIPIIIMTPLYIYMAIQAWRQAKQIADIEEVNHGHTGNKRHIIFKTEMKMFRVTALLLGYFTFAWIPYITYEIIYMTCECEISPYIRATVRLLLHSNSAVNIWIYAARIKEVRELLKQDCLKLPCCSKKNTKRSQHFSTDYGRETTGQAANDDSVQNRNNSNIQIKTVS